MTWEQQHKIGSGFGAHSTARDVLAGIDLTGKTALVTGGYSGLGLAGVRALVEAGARVVVPARRLEVAREALRGVARVDVFELDLGDLESVRRFSDHLVADGRTLDIVITNAGIMACPETRVGPGWEAQFATNHLGHFALVNRLRPLFADDVRVVSVTSAGHFLSSIRWDDLQFEDGYDRWLAYGQSKTANALFAVHLNALGVQAFTTHPGSILTPLQRHIPHEDQVARGWITEDGSLPDGFKTPEQGAATAIWAATSPLLNDLGGLYTQDCDVAEPATGDDMLIGGVKPWAVDPDDASRLWKISADLTGQGR
ncbi:SDR family NAD(P)-dependent oxidoreductase [Actinomadura rupiterrae]|uniref:SDR family NAD(P)-dependent oxidoreductase n=1 Tax=Actinomadura rupiterrae TaxID=559627 RepID=UPI0020A3B53B|nr:SDR family NAD(P)-dependent oxidoreductase [Actinomadura rupiterrae]MCP2340270.1 NAD(P)-dependent dehydrogenase (short-subunit alcohol dehydrogenase family) [Actinomadura rupiterrae]